MPTAPEETKPPAAAEPKQPRGGAAAVAGAAARPSRRQGARLASPPPPPPPEDDGELDDDDDLEGDEGEGDEADEQAEPIVAAPRARPRPALPPRPPRSNQQHAVMVTPQGRASSIEYVYYRPDMTRHITKVGPVVLQNCVGRDADGQAFRIYYGCPKSALPKDIIDRLEHAEIPIGPAPRPKRATTSKRPRAEILGFV